MSVINEGNVLTYVIEHDRRLDIVETHYAGIERRHKAEDDEAHQRQKWRRDILRLAGAILVIVAADLLLRLLLWLGPTALTHIH